MTSNLDNTWSRFVVIFAQGVFALAELAEYSEAVRQGDMDKNPHFANRVDIRTFSISLGAAGGTLGDDGRPLARLCMSWDEVCYISAYDYAVEWHVISHWVESEKNELGRHVVDPEPAFLVTAGSAARPAHQF